MPELFFRVNCAPAMREKPLPTRESVMEPCAKLAARETALSNNRQAVHL